ncbi:MAG: leucine-rich repeat protein, partial [Bacteroidales bacterium]|nr:leucine-rich repeat protein [Bacteroidales bacterium]
MKAKLLLFISLISVSLFAQNVNIPDINFKQALLNDNNINTVDDGEISFSEAENATSITAIELEIEDLTGVEAFINLTLLEVSRNKIANIDITPLTKLTRLYVDRNLLTEIELGYNTILEELYVDANHLTSLNVKNNTSLIRLWAKGNNYTEICVWDIEFAENLESSEFFNKDASVDWTTDCICVCSYVLTLSDVSFENGTISNFVNDTEKSIIIPSELDGQPVTSIASSTFYNKDLTCVDIPKGITSIGAHAFWGNKLKNIKIPPGVTVINEWSFSYNELDSIDISDNVTKIDRFAFLGNNLKSVNLPDGVDIKAAAFNDNIINTVNGKNSNGTFFKRYNAVISIVSYGGGNTVIESDIITTEVTSLGNYAFTRNKLNSVVIPNNITSIGEHCFSNNNIKKAVLPINIDEIQKGTFLDNELTSIEIPSRVRYIGEYAFSDNELVTIVLPDGIKDIKKWAFYSNKLTSIIIPNSATRIEGGVFNSNKITSINGEASNGIVYGYFDNEEINIYKIISYGGEKDIVDFIPEIVTHIGTNAFARNNISSVIIPDNILSIGVTSFQYNELIDIDINNVVSIGEGAFL